MNGEAFGLTPQHACPDCHPETLLDDLGGNVYVLRVHHAKSCPTFARMTAEHHQKDTDDPRRRKGTEW